MQLWEQDVTSIAEQQLFLVENMPIEDDPHGCYVVG